MEQRCPICAGRSIVILYAKLYDSRSLLNCRDCKISFVYPRVFNKNAYSLVLGNELNRDIIDRIKTATADKILAVIDSYKSVKSTLLDVGCGLGHLVIRAADSGWDSYGIDRSEHTVAQAQNRFGSSRIALGDFTQLPLGSKTYDVITLIDVIEHTYEIRTLLNKCKDALAEKGILAIVTPDLDSFSRKCLKRYWPHFNSDHVIFISSHSVGDFLATNGFTIMAIKQFRKVFNLDYLLFMLKAKAAGRWSFFVDILNNLLPKAVRRRDFSLLHGESLIIVQKPLASKLRIKKA